jgi:hypothetical protein
MAEKRGDYFSAGTQVVWDVDVLREERVLVYRASASVPPSARRGLVARRRAAVLQTPVCNGTPYL